MDEKNDPEKLWKPTIEFVGPMALHNMPCSICREEFAVFFCNEGFFEPCWICQRKGWETWKKPKPNFVSRFWEKAKLKWRP